MDAQVRQALARLIQTQRVAALGTTSDNAPLVTMILYVAAADSSAFYIHISRLAQHTQAILQDRRVGLMIAEPDAGQPDPQTLARVAIRGEATEIPPTARDYEAVRDLYLATFPRAAANFALGDFGLYRIAPHQARYIGGFGQIFDLTAEDFKNLGR